MKRDELLTDDGLAGETAAAYERQLTAEGMPDELPPTRVMLPDDESEAHYRGLSRWTQWIRDPRDRRIWELHCEGRSQREIAAVDGRSRWAVLRTIRRLKACLV